MNAEYDFLIKCVIAGDSGAGKSSLLQRYVDRSFDECFVSTIGVDFKMKDITLSSGKEVKLQLWDTAGQERFRTIVSSYWRGADGVAFVFDLTDMESFKSVSGWAEEVDRYSNRQIKIQKILIGNKCDLVEKREVSREMAETLAKTLGIPYYEASAKIDVGVDQAFNKMAEAIAKDYQQLHGIKRNPSRPSRPSSPGRPRDAPLDSSTTCCIIS